MQNTLWMLLGAALVSLGVLASALADRVRGLHRPKRSDDPEWSEWAEEPVVAPRARRPRTASAADTVFVPDEPVELLRARSTKPARAFRPEPKEPTPDGAEDVIAALVAAGYKKPIATEATWGCSAAERASVEEWVRAALRRCARRGAA